MTDQQLYLVTPTVYSGPLSKLTGLDVYLKLDNLQPPGSFKIRGISYMCKKAVYERGCTHLVTASGGNAGMAMAYAAVKLNVKGTVVIPESTSVKVADSLRELGAEVIVHGTVYDHASKYAKELASKPGAQYVPAFDHEEIWEGHASIITEAADQMPVKPDIVVTCVGGGGLLIGIIKGMHRVGWTDVPVVAMETNGAHCFNAAIKAGKLVTLPAITSIAKCLGALTVAERLLDSYQKKEHEIHSVVVEDKEAIKACLQLADDHRILVEPACGAALAAIYSGTISNLQREGKLGAVKTVLVEICGGTGVNLGLLQQWKTDFQL